MSGVTVTGLAKRYGANPVLHPTDLDVAAGELLVIVGASGCGKSTLLRLIAGLEVPDAGRVTISGRDVTERAPAERGLAMVFQSYALYPHLSVAENIAFPLRAARWPRVRIAERVAEVAALLELRELLARRPKALSGGQRQRVSIGRAIAREPAVLLLDEPLSNLDAGLRVRMRHVIARLHQRLGATMIYVTHDQLEAMTLANRIAVMAAGRIEQVGAPMALYAAPATVDVARAIGSPAINLLPVTIASTGPGSRVRFGDEEIATEACVPAADAGAPATLGVRPEHLAIDARGPFAGPVELFERLGPLSFAHVGGRDATLVAQLPGDSTVTLGETLRFSARPCDLHLFDAAGRAYPRLIP
ncbi:ABC transporter ATP-binding protein [Sphingomonas sp.]|uniref:ABC transporter ATP-binding protein n=1 Tax=Sphingomonas sp. TaxID=28214 RepID=UPI003AFFCBBA